MSNQLVKKVITCAVSEVVGGGQDRVISFVGSMETPDRLGDRVHADGWMLDNYKKNPVFLWCHDYRQPPIGKAVDCYQKDGSLMFKIQFADAETYAFADTCYKLYKGGFLNAVSVGFSPQDFKEYSEDGKSGMDYNKQELLELSGCPIPAHPDALVSARSQGLITVKDLEMITSRAKTLSQAEITDELDYCIRIIEADDLNAINRALATRFATALNIKSGKVILTAEEFAQYRRLTECDNSDENIELKALETYIKLIENKLGGNK